MHLKQLELSGFKSFAKKTFLEFSAPITAIVGPNGSGKSNIAEAIQWVLGEQSLKSLRGKKSEDLIFNGSEKTPRQGRASVALVFDNSKKQFPLEFESVEIRRTAYRDGANEYLINDSKVRLKDIIELLTNVGLGSSRHHIISQGESDRMLYASSEERRQMIEDALGIKIYQLRRKEAERKLESTRENARQTEGIRKEVQPHLKFLKNQAEKFRIASSLREELTETYAEYIARESAQLASKESSLAQKIKKPRQKLENIEKEIEKSRKIIEKKADDAGALKEIREIEFALSAAREKRLGAERELGKIEGMIELKTQDKKTDKKSTVERGDVEHFISEVEKTINDALSAGVIGEIKGFLRKINGIIENFSSSIGKRGNSKEAEELTELKTKKESAADFLAKTQKEENGLEKRHSNLTEKEREERNLKNKKERELYDKQICASSLKDQLRAFQIEEEKLKMEKSELERCRQEAAQFRAPSKTIDETDDFPETSRLALWKKIEKFKIKLEEAGGVAPEVMKEYSETLSRDRFLEKELADLKGAAESCRQMIKELEERLENEFKRGVEKINEEFQKFFVSMFGGGRALLKINSPKNKKQEQGLEENGVEEAFAASGVDITVDIPKKRIRSLEALSGGEKALTSSALLFAMSSVNPPPFLVLDEADAAFDEANSKRYSQMLEGLSKKTQLIIVTHNRETMKQAGILYGVTMGSDSSSRLLSVKLEKAEEMAKAA